MVKFLKGRRYGMNPPGSGRYGKRGVALWLSWVLMVSFLVVLSVIMFSWTKSYMEDHAETLTELSDTAECASIGLSIDSACQDTQVLVINITNRNDLKISSLAISVYDIYLENIQNKEMNITLSPGKTETITLIKQGTTRQIDITPIFFTENNIVHCNEKRVSTDEISFC